MVDENKSGSGSSWYWPLVIVGGILVGVYVIRQGVGHYRAQEPPTVRGFTAAIDTGAFSHDLQVTNFQNGDHDDCDVTFVFYRQDGQRPEVKQFWSKWKQSEVKKINMPAHQYQKVVLKGTAKQDQKPVKVDCDWSWTWNGK